MTLCAQAVGSHLGGMTPFEVDITKPSIGVNTILLRVELSGSSLADTLASGSQYAVSPHHAYPT